MQLCLKCLVLQMILQNRRLRHFYFFRNILEPVRLRIFDWIFRILQVVHRILNNCRRKSILRECSGYLVFDVPVRKQVQQKRRWNDEKQKNSAAWNDHGLRFDGDDGMWTEQYG